MATFLLGVYLILVGLGSFFGLGLPEWVSALCALVAGILFLVGSAQSLRK